LYGSKVGIVDGDQRFTYTEYDLRINRFANALTRLGIVEGDVVSFFTYNSHQLLEAYYAVPQVEGVLNPINIHLAPGEIEYILNYAESRALCSHYDFFSLVKKIKPSLPDWSCLPMPLACSSVKLFVMSVTLVLIPNSSICFPSRIFHSLPSGFLFQGYSFY